LEFRRVLFRSEQDTGRTGCCALRGASPGSPCVIISACKGLKGIDMLVLGIDPGIAITGYGLVREVRGGDVELVAYGAVETPAHTPLPLRLQQVYKGVREVVEQYRPESAAIEKLLFGKNVTTAMAVGQDRKSTRLNSSHVKISYAVLCLKKKKTKHR